MSDPSLPLQSALITELRSNAVGVADRVYDKVPESPTFPYVTIGDAQVLPDKADCIDGTEIFFQVDAWSRAVGYPEVKGIAASIIDRLDDRHGDSPNMTITGFTLVVMELVQIQHLRDPDGLTRHAAIQFRALIQSA